ncbi:MAG: CHRD domain-containing protein [Chitinophagaceae bacterium]
MIRVRIIAGLLIACGLASCNQDLNTTIIAKNDVVLDGSQEVPAKSSAGNGTMNLAYNRTTRTLSYTVKWNSLTGVPVGMHIHGSAGKGANAAIVQNFSGFPVTQSGTYTGTFFVDGVSVKEEDFLRGGYYLNIHTAINPGGEIRGQIILQ